MEKRITVPGPRTAILPTDVPVYYGNGDHFVNLTGAQLEAIVRQGLELLPEAARLVEPVLDEELGRWQTAIRDEVIQSTGCPPEIVDGSGCDSGDPLDLTLTEIGLAVNWLVDEHAGEHADPQPSHGLKEALPGGELTADELQALRWCIGQANVLAAGLPGARSDERINAAAAALGRLEGLPALEPQGDAARFRDGLTDGQREAAHGGRPKGFGPGEDLGAVLKDHGLLLRDHAQGILGLEDRATALEYARGETKRIAAATAADVLAESLPSVLDRLEKLEHRVGEIGSAVLPAGKPAPLKDHEARIVTLEHRVGGHECRLADVEGAAKQVQGRVARLGSRTMAANARLDALEQAGESHESALTGAEQWVCGERGALGQRCELPVGHSGLCRARLKAAERDMEEKPHES